MNNSESAKKGFRTFLLTLSISLMVFSAIYYALTNYQGDKSSESQTVAVANTDRTQEVNVQGAKDAKEAVVAGETGSVFAELAKKKPEAKVQQVLAGATSAPQTTQSVPDTGAVEITIGLVLSLVFFVAGMAIVAMNPRKLALRSFEKHASSK
jgi:hypothetical protein